MIIPPVGGLGAELSSAATGTAQTSGAGGVEGVPGVEGVADAQPAEGTQSTSGGFGSSLSEAISALESGQTSASSASQALATGTVSDPEAAVTTVEDASLEMQLAAQIRAKATEAAQTIFQTQV
jgi:flagellar hook-basal body complex protein FliE